MHFFDCPQSPLCTMYIKTGNAHSQRPVFGEPNIMTQSKPKLEHDSYGKHREWNIVILPDCQFNTTECGYGIYMNENGHLITSITYIKDGCKIQLPDCIKESDAVFFQDEQVNNRLPICDLHWKIDGNVISIV